MSRLASPLILALCAGCGSSILETSVINRRPFVALPSYAAWWTEVETCSGRTGPLMRVDWFIADGLTQDRKRVLAVWEEPHRITLLSDQTATELVVKHEMLHDLLNGDPEHTDRVWEACGLDSVAG